jgi:hypothetical protein
MMLTLTPRLRMLALIGVVAVIMIIIVVVALDSSAGSQVGDSIRCHLRQQLDCGRGH